MTTKTTTGSQPLSRRLGSATATRLNHKGEFLGARRAYFVSCLREGAKAAERGEEGT